jgi:hypothetical protein
MRRLVPFLVLFAGCRPDFGLPVSVVTEPRILSVQASPPEARPGATVHLTTMAVAPEGPLSSPVDYAFCASPRPLIENNVVSSDCLGPTGVVTPIASQVQEVDAALPLDGCLNFGPDTPPQMPGQPPLRARDPDITGGYYQPVRVVLSPDVEAVALVRIRCNLPGASAQRAVEFAERYVDNQNPQLSAIELRRDGAAIDPQAVPARTQVTLHVSWPSGTAESYVVHDRSTDTLVDHREALRVSWFTTSGLIPIVTTGRAEDDEGSDTETEWQTPDSGSGTLWAVIRDSRGGLAVQVLPFTIQ